MSSKEYSLKDSLKRCVRHNPWITFFMVCIIAGTAVLAIVPPLILGQAVDLLAEGKAVPLPLAVEYVLLLAGASLLEALQEGLIAVFGQKMAHTLRSQMAEKLNHLPASFFLKQEAGETVSLFTNDVDTIEDLFDEGVISMFSDALSIISIMTVIFTRSKGLGWLLICVLPFLYALTRHFQKNMLRAQKENREAVGRTTRMIPETMRNIRMVHVYHLNQWMAERYGRSIDDSFRAIDRSNFFDSIYSPIIIEVSAIITGIMMLAAGRGGSLQAFFGMSAGTAVAIIAYVGKIFNPLESIGMEIQNIQSAAAGIARITEFMNEAEKPEEKKQSADLSAPALQMNDVTFGYTGDQTILDHFSMNLESAETASLIGRTGGGKSTIFRLFNGLYEPGSGEVKVYGMNPAFFNEEDRRIMATVEQSFHPVDGTIRDQITLKDEIISDEQVENALKLTGLYEVVEKLPDKENTAFDAAKFSQGQQQLLSIARAVVRNPKILLLDEITASLDSLTEEKVLLALQHASENRAVLSISHRLYEKHGGRRIPVGKDAAELLNQ